MADYASSEAEQWLLSAVMTGIFAWMVYVLASILFSFKENNLQVSRKVKEEGVKEVQEPVMPRGEEEWHLLQSENEVDISAAEELNQRKPEEPAENVILTSELIPAPTLPCNETVNDLGNQDKRDNETGEPTPVCDASVKDGLFVSEDVASTLGNASKELTVQLGSENDVRIEKPKEQASDVVASADSEDEWEGVETSELEDHFHSAATVVSALATGPGIQGGEGLQLLLYALYKQATEGSCTSAQPPFFNVKARRKWDAWSKLGQMTSEEAMAKYIELVVQMHPELLKEQESKVGDQQGESSKQQSVHGPVFSTYVDEEGEGSARSLTGAHHCASVGDVKGLRELMDEGADVNARDEEGRTALHWAVDRGHKEVVELLLSKGVLVDAQDKDKQTPLHYACICEREDIAKALVQHGASLDIPDSDGSTARDTLPVSWETLT